MNEKKAVTGSEPWHARDLAYVFERFLSGTEGLTQEEADRRLEEYGPNRLPAQKRRGPLMRFISQFHNVLIYVLLAAALGTALMNHWADAAVILAVVLINAFIGFIQEGKAEEAIEAIRDLLSPTVTVLRDGRRVSVESEKLAPGDMVYLQTGDRVSADMRLTYVKQLRIDEAALTGESVPVDKMETVLDEDLSLGDRSNMAFSGTLVIYGQGAGVVVGTGENTELGRISSLMATVQAPTTKLLRQMAQFGRWLTGAIILLSLVAFGFGVFFRDYTVEAMFLAAVGIAVAAIPEGLPAIVSITLAIGVQRMARRRAIIRKLPSVETLGSVTVICSDKTGTLTRNEMTVKTVVTPTQVFEVRGVGYAPEGRCSLKGKEVDCREYPEILELARGGVLCNEASVHPKNGEYQLHGDPTEGALVVLGMKAGLDVEKERTLRPRLDVIPFESEHRFMASLHREEDGTGVIHVKGAPERILEMCEKERRDGTDSDLDPEYWESEMEEVAGRGQRLLAVAMKRVATEVKGIGVGDVESGLTLLGMVGIIDPPRGAAISAVKQCRSAGIRVKMITGDHTVTARAIGAQMGIGDGTYSLSGRELDELDDERLREVIPKVDVFARVNPGHKLRIVRALQSDGEVVAMTGDGVNDAPALKSADIGVAMGIKGTEVAKEAAGMVLADDNFASIAHAVEEGRTVYDNIRKAIMFILPTNAGEAGIIVTAILLGRTLPITPIQILWVNMITAVTLALALAFEPSEADVMRRPPRHPDEPILSRFLLWRVFFVSIIVLSGTFGLFVWERAQGASIEVARTVAVNTLVMFEIFYLLCTRHLTASALSQEGLCGNGYALAAMGVVVALQLVFTYAPPVTALFGVAPIDGSAWVRIVGIAFLVLVLVEVEKFVLRKRGPIRV